MRPIVVRGGGDIATGTVAALSRAGYPVIILECARPTAIRRKVAFCDAIYERDRWYGEGTKTVEGITCTLTSNIEDAMRRAQPGRPMILIDPEAKSLARLKPDVLVDAILAKKNLGTTIDMAPLTIALGPGFTAGVDVRCVIETMRGHDLGRILYEGTAMENTGVPGMVAGYGRERVIHAPASGRLELISGIGEIVEKGKIIAVIDTGKARVKVPASLSGVLRGILPENFEVTEGMKMADIDPRVDQVENCSKISDKARCIGGSVLQLVVAYEKGLLK
ncbi:MAG: EF2563 family selenium-dependent molybdenum hydroxylase system protein [Lachnospiraceae bacterium]|nr:EF2563 family selenium-dependent molybdenum hydroxylase system protein [Lachnospiraceae bacterium]